MVITGVDYHPSDQYIAFVDTKTGEYGERQLNHSDREAEKFYRELAARGASVRVGMEATGYSTPEIVHVHAPATSRFLARTITTASGALTGRAARSLSQVWTNERSGEVSKSAPAVPHVLLRCMGAGRARPGVPPPEFISSPEGTVWRTRFTGRRCSARICRRKDEALGRAFGAAERAREEYERNRRMERLALIAEGVSETGVSGQG
jgi:hypothetical protein